MNSKRESPDKGVCHVIKYSVEDLNALIINAYEIKSEYKIPYDLSIENPIYRTIK